MYCFPVTTFLLSLTPSELQNLMLREATICITKSTKRVESYLPDNLKEETNVSTP